MLRLSRKGFTLVEIMIVVAIIALLAAIAIPNLLRARISANEAAAISTLKAISTACESYRVSQTPVSYPTSMGAMSSEDPPYIDSRFDAALGAYDDVQGYRFTYVRASANAFDCGAVPINDNVTGVRKFAINEQGVVFLDADGNGVVDSGESPIE